MEPTIAARIGQACYECFKEAVTLKKCSKCRRVVYCSPECQIVDWPMHKRICKIFQCAEQPESGVVAKLWNQPNEIARGDRVALLYTRGFLGYVQMRLPNLPKPLEYLITHEPKCLACGRPNNVRSLTPCADCNTVFYCSPAHWDAVRKTHMNGSDGEPKQCATNKQIRAHEAFLVTEAGKRLATRSCVTQRIAETWVPLGSDGDELQWEEKFGEELRAMFALAGADPVERHLWAASDPLSMPMTVLYALQELNDTDAWSRKDTLVIHVLGAYEMEVFGAAIFEEILHRVPAVKHLQILFCGPELMAPHIRSQIKLTKTFGVNQCCADCRGLDRTRRHMFTTELYHAFLASQGSRFQNPDLAIAFNSGASEESPELWLETFECLIHRNIPTVFTSYNQIEAETDAALLRMSGASLHPSLTRRRNPWGSLLAKPEPARLRGFFYESGWLAGAFK
ncbi:hypothetical protein DFH07DRAFT_830420 [Mycena maculata]|uniref:MYND-type domain-containing protein n=1 Tax=Mycena maculata TaxID=230809 RepID=A0AAD7IQ74_9AGAR|nr:hypothetical protein DFH07DRAFT_830420 [Mycena maculata]